MQMCWETGKGQRRGRESERLFRDVPEEELLVRRGLSNWEKGRGKPDGGGSQEGKSEGENHLGIGKLKGASITAWMMR